MRSTSEREAAPTRPGEKVQRDSPGRGRWLAYAACAWAILFAIPNLYWAAGGAFGAGTIGGEIERRAVEREPAMVAALWVSGVIKLAAGIFALALARPWGRKLPRRLLIGLGMGGGLSTLFYGIALTVQHGLMLAGILDQPESLDTPALRWHLFLWDPIWILGGALFTLATWQFMRREAVPGSCQAEPIG